MNSASDLGAGAGSLVHRAEIADERVCSVRVVSSRPTHLTRLFIAVRRRNTILAERIYSLCGLSHAIVATRAIGAARGAASPRKAIRRKASRCYPKESANSCAQA